MNKTLILFLISILMFEGCSKIKSLLPFFGKKKEKEGITTIQHGDVEKLRTAFQDGRIQALEELIGIYQDSNQSYDVRLAAGESLAETHHPNALNAIAETVASSAAIDLSFMEFSIDLLAKFKENPKAAEAMIRAMHTIQKKTNKLHLYLVKNLGKVRIKDQVYALMDLYEVAKSNLSRTEELLTTTLGTIGDDKVIPALVDIAKDPYINIGIRNRAVEILGKKETTEIVGAFTELLGDPNTNLEVREFALNTMEGVTEEKLILTLLDTYNVGKKQYFSLLNTLIDALGNFKDPKIRNALTEIALNNDYDLALRKKAINKLGESGDVSVIPTFLSLLSHSDNYNIYHEITTLVKTLGVTDKYQEEIRRLAFKAHLNSELYE